MKNLCAILGMLPALGIGMFAASETEQWCIKQHLHTNVLPLVAFTAAALIVWGIFVAGGIIMATGQQPEAKEKQGLA